MTLASVTTEHVASNAAGLIGRTPLMELTRTGAESRLLMKLEQFNPTGSTKVRMAREMILAAERSDMLKPGGTIAEPTSGNTGTGLALVAIERGYRFIAVVDRHASKDKLRAMQAMGAHLVMVEGSGEGPSTVERRRIAGEIARDTGAFWPDQHHKPNNNAGYAGLAEELLSDLATDIDDLVGAVGTGGTMCGTVQALRERGSAATGIGVEPKGSIIFGGPGGQYWQTGAGAPAGFKVGPNVRHELIDEGVTVSDMDAFTTARVVALRTGLLVGGTAGAAIFIALKRLALVEPGSTMVVLVCDAGEKYLDTVYDDAWLMERGLLNEPAHQRLHRLLAAFEESRRLAAIDHARTGT